MKKQSFDIKKPIKLKIESQTFADNHLTTTNDNFKATIKEMEKCITKNIPLSPQLTAKALQYLKNNQQSVHQLSKSSYFDKSSKTNLMDKQNKKILNMSQSAMMENGWPQQSLLLQNKQSLIGRIKLKRIVENKKYDLGQCQQATPIKSGLIIKNMKQRMKNMMLEKEQADKKIIDLQNHIQDLEEQKRDSIPHPNNLVRIQCVFNLNFNNQVVQECDKVKENNGNDENLMTNFKDQMIDNLKNIVAVQNIEIQNLRSKLLVKKEANRSRWIS